MKLLFAQQSEQRRQQKSLADNNALHLAVEVLEGNGDLPPIDVIGARLDHWNGRKISVARADLIELIDRGLLDRCGRWTEYGRREAARQAGMEAPTAAAMRLR